MAELVHRNVEAMLPELADCERNNIFDGREIKMILKRRTQYEYRLARRIVKKADFLCYIQFELSVDRLRRNRCKLRRVSGTSAAQNFSIVRRIHRLFRSATLKFKGDLKLWMEYIKFCQRFDSVKKVHQVLQDALKYHSYCDGLWVLAAKVHFDGDNINAARSSMLGALRVRPKSEKIWLEYFRMEIVHVNKLQQFSCHLADKIYNAATENVDTLSIQLRFLDVYLQYSFTEKSCDRLYQHLAEKYADDPKAVSVLCMRPLRTQVLWSAAYREEREMECDKLFKTAVERLPTSDMWEHYCQFWHSITEHYQLKRNAAGLQRAVMQYFCVCQKAAEQKAVSVAIGLQWIEMLLSSGNGQHAVTVLDQLLKLHPDEEFRLKRLQLEATDSDVNVMKVAQTVSVR